MAPALRARKTSDPRVTLYEPIASTSSTAAAAAAASPTTPPSSASRSRKHRRADTTDDEAEAEAGTGVVDDEPVQKKAAKGKGKGKAKAKTAPKPEVESRAPPNPRWRAQYDVLAAQRERIVAPVDTMGCADAGKSVDSEPRPDATERDRRYHTLVSLMLSSQTKDEVTAAATAKLRTNLKGGLTVSSLLAASDEEIFDCIRAVGFNRTKTGYLRRAAQILHDKHDDDVPKTIEELLELPGVGPKMGFLALLECWGLQHGIGVDTHVHRMSNRLRWHGKKETTTAEQTRLSLESWLPKDLHGTINKTLVGFAQVVCLPVGPRCDLCDLAEAKLCPSRKSVVASTSSPRSSPAKSRGLIRPKVEVEIELERGTPTAAAAADVKPNQLALKVEPAELDGERIEGVVKVESDAAAGPVETRIIGDAKAKVEEVTTSW